jgi:hypothetical protein
MLEARVVEMQLSEGTNSWFCPFQSVHKPCALLEFCRESRGFYLRDWVPLALGMDSDKMPKFLLFPKLLSQLAAGESIPMAHFNSKIDTAYVDLFVESSISEVGAALALVAGLRRLAFGFNTLYIEDPQDIHRIDVD